MSTYPLAQSQDPELVYTAYYGHSVFLLTMHKPFAPSLYPTMHETLSPVELHSRHLLSGHFWQLLAEKLRKEPIAQF